MRKDIGFFDTQVARQSALRARKAKLANQLLENSCSPESKGGFYAGVCLFFGNFKRGLYNLFRVNGGGRHE